MLRVSIMPDAFSLFRPKTSKGAFRAPSCDRSQTSCPTRWSSLRWWPSGWRWPVGYICGGIGKFPWHAVVR